MAKNEQAQPVSLYVEDPRLPRTLRGELQKAMESIIQGAADGLGADEYREAVGQIRGYRDAIRICQEYEKELSEN